MSFYVMEEILFRNSLRDAVQYACHTLVTSRQLHKILNFVSLLYKLSNWARGHLKRYYVVIGSACLHLGIAILVAN